MVNIVLKELRKQNNYSKKQIANFLNVDQSLITKYEKGKRKLGVDLIQRLANLYGIDYKKLINNEDLQPLKTVYRTKEFTSNNLEVITKINTIILNLHFLDNLKD